MTLKDTKVSATNEIFQNYFRRHKIIETNKLFSELNRKIKKPLKQMMPPN